MWEKLGKFTAVERGLHFDGAAEETHAEVDAINKLMVPVPETPAADFMRTVLDLRLAAQRRLIEAKGSQDLRGSS